VEFRRLVLSDLDSYFANRLRALQNSPSAFLTTYEEEKRNGSDHFAKTLSYQGKDRIIFGAVENGKVVGTIGLFQEEREKLIHKATIWGMYVDVEWRKSGVGAKLVDLAIHYSKNHLQVTGVYLSVEANNASARRLYESKGFKVWGTEPKAMAIDGKFFDEDHMALLFV
jgi:RimJ/RimL family protein N-acetyltransferase